MDMQQSKLQKKNTYVKNKKSRFISFAIWNGKRGTCGIIVEI